MSLINFLTKHPKRSAALFAFIMFLVYACMTPAFNVGYGDSDEFLSVGETWGLAHPPGYPLYVTVLHGAMKLPIPGTTPAWRANVVSGLSLSIALYFGILFLYTLSASVSTKKRSSLTTSSASRLVAIYTSALIVGSAKLIWTYALIAEKYIFAAPFMMAIMYFSTRLLFLQKNNTQHNQLIFLVTFLYGLLITHHQATIFLLPYLCYVLVKSLDKKTRIKSGLFALTGLLLGLIVPLLIIIYRLNSNPSISWKTEKSVQGIFNLLTRRDFQGEIIERNINADAYIPKSITLNQVITSSKQFTLSLLESFQWWIVLPIIFGLVYIYHIKDRRLMVITIVPFVLMGYLLAIYLSWPTDMGSQATTLRFFTLGFIFILPLVYFGMKEMLDRSINVGKILGNKKTTGISLAIIGCIPLTVFLITGSNISVKKFTYVSTLYSDMMNQFEPNGLVTCYSDTSCFALLYEQTVNHKRPDITIVPIAYPLNEDSINIKSLQRFTYDTNPNLLLDIVTWNIGKRPVYAVDLSPYYYNLYGIDYAFLYYIPLGYYGRLDRQFPTQIQTYDDSLSNKIAAQGIDESDLMQRRIIKSIAQNHFNNAHIFLFLNDRNRARLELDDAVNLSYQLTNVEKKGAIATRNQIEQTVPHGLYGYGKHILSADELLSRIPLLYKQNKNSQAYWLVMGSLIADPTNLNGRLELARIYHKMGDSEFSYLEYKHVLMLDPKNQEAIDQLSATFQ